MELSHLRQRLLIVMYELVKWGLGRRHGELEVVNKALQPINSLISQLLHQVRCIQVLLQWLEQTILHQIFQVGNDLRDAVF